jgi:hypothetical protein
LINGSDVLAAAAACHGFLESVAGADWSAAVPGLNFTVASVDAAPPGIRGFHPAGAADPSGFAAMACDELLVHTNDAARGLGLRFTPDPELAGRVLARLFPWHDPGDDAWQTLLWANGRIDLPGHPNQANWAWHCAPLADWNGRPAQRVATG